MYLRLLLSILLLLRPTIAEDVSVKWDGKDDRSWEVDFGSYPYKTYHTIDLISPAVRKESDSPQCYDDNYVFLAPRGYQMPHRGVIILDNHGELVWEMYTVGEPYNLKVQEYQGEKVLTFWVGNDAVGGHGEGDYYMYNSKYEQIAKISGLNGLHADLHELTITSEGTALMTIYEIVPIHHPGMFEDSDQVWVWDCLIQEIDLATNDLVFEWRASQHHSLDETHRPLGGDGYTSETAWDWYHMNSIQKDELGNYLVSARYTYTITYINGTSGEIIWVLGGKRNAFEDLSDGHAINIAYQHSARLYNLTEFPNLMANEIQAHGPAKDKDGVTKMLVAAFDNGADHEWTSDRPSRGVLIEVTYPTLGSSDDSSSAVHTARLVQQYQHPLQFVASSQGSIQMIPSENGDPKVLLGYGFVGVWAEFSADGQILCDNRFSNMQSWGTGNVQSYRALKAPWVGQPTWPPFVGLAGGFKSSVFVSWNGATEVRYWKIQQSAKQGDLDEGWEDIITVEKKSFETEIEYEDCDLRFLRVVGLDQYNNTLGSSSNIDLGWSAGVNRALVGFQSRASNPLQIVMVSLGVITFGVIFYECFRQIRSWRERKSFGYEKVGLNNDGSSYA